MPTSTMNPDKARSILIEARKAHGEIPAVYEGDVPEDDDKAISEADAVVELARDARAADFENEAITAILSLFEMDGGSPSDPNRANGSVAAEHGVKPPWENYPDQKVSQILHLLDGLSDDELAEVYDFEKATKNRTTIISVLEEMAQEKGVGETPFGDNPEPDDDDADPAADELAAREEPLAEPWRGYDKRKVDQILRKLPKLDEEELAEVFEYETRNKDRKAVIKALNKLAEQRAPEPEPEPEPDDQPQDTAPAETQEDEYDPEHHELVQKVTEKIDQENLSIPKPLPRERLEMPFDLTELSDVQLRRLHGAFNAYSSRAAYVLMLEEQLETACKHVADEKANRVIFSLPKVDEETKKDKNITTLKAEAENDDTVALWRDRQRVHGALAEAMRKERDIYDKNVQVLSRDWTMRHEQYEHDGLSNPTKRRGK